jgi:predicted anti-sigma-YlaC factor YlaD
MDCDTVRRLMEDGEREGAVAAHLDGCAACRAEAEFGRRVAAAVAAMPRAGAPESLAARVMAEVRQRPEAARPTGWFPQFALRPWEMGWIGVLCLLLLALIPTALGRWGWPGALSLSAGSLWEWVASFRSAGGGALAGPQAWGRELAGLWNILLEHSPVGASAWLTGLCGAAAFAVGFYLLLSWRAEGGGMQAMEDAHA